MNSYMFFSPGSGIEFNTAAKSRKQAIEALIIRYPHIASGRHEVWLSELTEEDSRRANERILAKFRAGEPLGDGACDVGVVWEIVVIANGEQSVAPKE